MSGAEVLGLISAIISIIDASVQIYKAANDVSGLPASFRQVYSRLPLILDTLKAAENGFDDQEGSPGSRTALVDLLKGCKDKAGSLERLFEATITSPEDSKLNRWMKAAKTIPHGGDVKALSEGILGDLNVLTSNYAVKFTTRQEMKRLIRLLDNQYHNSEESLVTLNNMASGQQYVKLNDGNQNVASGNSMQINGPASGIFNYSPR
ncbi:hypothetical protein CSAL01_01457 [Colletotrichum salicis]|uniref:NACHT-NTPase and P-loop NTPases N-terminal domain-containing protein n=1 Tax=Colletotrichum salicis TaxID=1209931 RepID=A0A135V928_9PEZI|nr:hypothetical protein CSAL01_01457 [Colletotrichum salicis]